MSILFQINTTEQYFSVKLFFAQYRIILAFGLVDKILKNEHTNESYSAVLCFGALHYAVQGCCNFSIAIILYIKV